MGNKNWNLLLPFRLAVDATWLSLVLGFIIFSDFPDNQDYTKQNENSENMRNDKMEYTAIQYSIPGRIIKENSIHYLRMGALIEKFERYVLEIDN